MNVLLDIGHPKDVNVFSNVILLLQERGHKIKIFARAKESTRKILEENGFEYKLCKYYKTMPGKAFGVLANDLLLYRMARKFKPDIFVSPGSPYSAHVSRLMHKPHLAFSDTEIAGLVTKLAFPFTDEIYTSTSFYLDLGPKQKRFRGYYELAYLHPKHFKPDGNVLNKYGLKAGYILVRLSALSSHHDIHAKGFNFTAENELKEYISVLEKYGKVIIFSEISDWQTIKDYQLEMDPKDLHNIIYHAALYIGEGATMASEAAVLGVPSIYVSNTQRGYLNELEQKYGLAYNISDKDLALEKAIKILGDGSNKDEWGLKKDAMLSDTVDVLDFIVNAIESHDQKGVQ